MLRLCKSLKSFLLSFLLIDAVISYQSHRLLSKNAQVSTALSTKRPVDALPLADVNRRAFLALCGGLATPPSANAFPLLRDRRQLDLCLVAVLRVLYWTRDLDRRFRANEQVQDVYLEARLGAKAILTKKIGGGANGRVISLGGLSLPEVLEDLESYAPHQSTFFDLRRDVIEALASLVEFDGFDSLTDPSPRASLTMRQYTDQKGTFCRRTISERLLPALTLVLNTFDPDVLQRSKSYTKLYYPEEVIEP